MTCTGFSSELYDLYTLGVLRGDEQAGIQDHLGNACDTCQQNVRRSLEVATRLAFAVPSIEPPHRLKTRITASVRPARTGVAAWFGSPASGWAAAAVCALAGASGVAYLSSEIKPVAPPVVVSRLIRPPEPTVRAAKIEAVYPAMATLARDLNIARSESAALSRDASEQQKRAVQTEAQLQAELKAKDLELDSARQGRSSAEAQLASASTTDSARVQDLQRQLVSNRQRLDALTRQVQFYQTAIQSQRSDLNRGTSLISLLSAPTLRVLDLRATEQGGGAFGHALISDNAPIVFYASKLPALPAGRTYQLWVMRDRGQSVISGGIFQPDASQSAMLTVLNAKGSSAITAFAVTEEPAGGVPLPTGHKILIGAAKA